MTEAQIQSRIYKLGELFKITSGGTPRTNNPSYYSNGTIPWIKTGDLKQRHLSTASDYITKEGIENSSAKVFPRNTVLLAMYGATIGACSILKTDAATNQACAAFLPNSDVNPEFLYFFLLSIKKKLINRGVGGGQPNISAQILKDIEINLPPLEVQDEIVRILEHADRALQQRREANRLTEQFLQSAFLEMFGDPVRNERGWEVRKGKDVFVFSSGKFNPTKNLSDSFQFPTYGGNGVTGFSDKFLIEYDTIVIGRVGAYCGSIHRTRGKCWITDNAIYIKKFLETIDLEFLMYLFVNLKLNRFAESSGQPKITQKPLEELNFIQPPIPKQQKFAALVDQVERLRVKQRESEKELEGLFQSLMGRYFG